MNSNYPRSEEPAEPPKFNLFLNGLGLAALFHFVLMLYGGWRIAPFFQPGSGANTLTLRLTLALLAIIMCVMIFVRSAKLSLGKKAKLILVASAIGSAMSLPLFWIVTGRLEFRLDEPLNFLRGFVVLGILFTLIAVPVWTVAYIARKRTARKLQKASSSLEASLKTGFEGRNFGESLKPGEEEPNSIALG